MASHKKPTLNEGVAINPHVPPPPPHKSKGLALDHKQTKNTQKPQLNYSNQLACQAAYQQLGHLMELPWPHRLLQFFDAPGCFGHGLLHATRVENEQGRSVPVVPAAELVVK